MKYLITKKQMAMLIEGKPLVLNRLRLTATDGVKECLSLCMKRDDIKVIFDTTTGDLDYINKVTGKSLKEA